MKVNTSESEDDAEFFVDYIPDDYSDCFGDLGRLNRTYHIELKDNVQTTVVPPRKVPFASRDKLKKELDGMEKMDVIERLEKSTDWVIAPVVFQKPNGKLRVCFNPRPLNQAIKRQHHCLPTAEQIISQMSDATTFSKLDTSNGYWQINVDKESSDLLIFGTMFGRYKFKRIPYGGIHSASEIFQLEISKIISGLEGCANSRETL